MQTSMKKKITMTHEKKTIIKITFEDFLEKESRPQTNLSMIHLAHFPIKL